MSEGFAVGYFDPTLFNEENKTYESCESVNDSDAWGDIDPLWLMLMLMMFLGRSNEEESEFQIMKYKRKATAHNSVSPEKEKT